MKEVTVLIPTYNRITSLAIVLTSLIYQTFQDFDVIISDQSTNYDVKKFLESKALQRVFSIKNIKVNIVKNLPFLGMAQQRAFLLNKSKSKYSLFLDDDVILEPFVIEGMVKAIKEEKCGYVGRGLVGLSYLKDQRLNQQEIIFWKSKVKPEKISTSNKKWNRYILHNAANLYHLEKRLKISWPNQKKYKIAWAGGCVLFDTKKLKSVGGFDFWKDLPKDHCGEDVLAQLKVMEKYGGCGLLPSGVYHQELITTIPNRKINAPKVLS